MFDVSNVIRSFPGVVAMSLLMLLSGCNNSEQEKTRSFYMAFTPFPYDLSQNAIDFVYEKLASDADIINHHFDDGVPWVEALSGQAFHREIIDDWEYRKSHTLVGHKIYLSVTPVNFARNGLALYRAASPDLPLPSPWDTYSFNHANVKAAYLAYCERIIDFFDPDYFNMAIEANLLHVKNPTLWSDYMELHEHVYTALKTKYPKLPIFCSISGGVLLNGFTDDDHTAEQQVLHDLMQFSDMYALSFYPYLSGYLGNPYPATTFDDLFSLSDKPLAIAETGYAAQDFSIDTDNGPVTIYSDGDKQNKYMEDLLPACTKRKAEFVINFVLRDYDQLWVKLGSPTDISIAWRDTGIYDENGMARKARTTWENYLQRRR